MLAKESVRKRIESETGISYTEFTYQLLQVGCVCVCCGVWDVACIHH